MRLGSCGWFCSRQGRPGALQAHLSLEELHTREHVPASRNKLKFCYDVTSAPPDLRGRARRLWAGFPWMDGQSFSSPWAFLWTARRHKLTNR